MNSSTLLHDIARIRNEIAAEYVEKYHVRPRAFVFSRDTPPVRIDPDFSLPVDHSKAEFVQNIKQTVKRLNATAVLAVSESWLTKLTATTPTSSPQPSQQEPTVVEAVLAALSQRDAPDMIWIAPIERIDGAPPLLKEWVESRPQQGPGMFFHFASEKLN